MTASAMMIKSGLAPLLAARMADTTRSSEGEQWLPGRWKAGPMDNTAWHQQSSCELAGRMVDRTLRALPPGTRRPRASRAPARFRSITTPTTAWPGRTRPRCRPRPPAAAAPARGAETAAQKVSPPPVLAGMVPKAAERAEGAVELVVRPALREVLLEPVVDGVQSRRGGPAAEQLASRPPCFYGRAVRAVWLRRRGRL
ncbi:hypothetical protein ACFVZ8_13830 [Streptomyces sp. NPDC059558]|uniref:hypothetical protein n=1 Tax=Streptomyces sp. NPDC059558 TaxID=3346864 RepID=UPI00367514D3